MSEIKLTADSGGGTTSIKAPSSTTSNADVVLKLPVADGSANQVLKTDGSGQLSFTSNAGTTINNNADNRIITGSGTASTLEGEANLTFDGTILEISNATPKLKLTDSDATGTPEAMVDGSGGDLILHVDKDNEKGSSLFAVEIDGSEKIRIDSSGTTTLKHSNDSGATTFKLENNSTANSTDPKVKIAVDLASGKDGGSIEFIRESNYQSSAAADSIIVISPTKNDTNQEAVRITQDWFRLHSNCSGIQFNSDTASANALNDYEEGTFTATCENSVTLNSTADALSYTKIGRQVTVRGQILINSDNSNADMIINNMPFVNVSTVEDSHLSIGACRLWGWDVPSDTISVVCEISSNNSNLNFWRNRDAAGADRLAADGGGYLGFTITYFTS